MSDHDLPIPFQDASRSLSKKQLRVLYWRRATGGENHEEAAEVAGVNVRTIYRWLHRPDFKAAWDDPEAWRKSYVATSRATLELKALDRAHALLDDPLTPATVQADVLAKSLTDVRQTKQLQLEAAQTQVWAEMLDQWSRRSDEILGAQKDVPQTIDNATIAGVEQDGTDNEEESQTNG